MIRLKEIMKDRGVSGYQLAKDTGVNNATIRNWLAGRAKTPRPKNIDKVANYLHIHPAWLLYGDSQYAPTLNSDALMLAEEIVKYGDDGIHLARETLKLLRTAKEKITSKGKPAWYKAGSG